MIRLATAVLCTAALLGCAGLPPGPPPDPLAVPEPDTLATLTAADGIACITTTSGAGYCWGDIGQAKGSPIRILRSDGSPAPVRSIAPSSMGICAVTVQGEVWCDPQATGGWTDSAGAGLPVPPECGYGACILPLPVQGEMPAQVRAVARGWSSGCALAYDGAAYCWGRNDIGELGNGTWGRDPESSLDPFSRGAVAVAGGVRFSQISARGQVTCGVGAHNGGIFCWGDGHSGQTGDSTLMHGCHDDRPCSSVVPSRVLPDSMPGAHDDPSWLRFAQVSAGGGLACAVDAGGRVFCWGDNYRCALGRCRRSNSPRAQYIPLPGRAVEVHAGARHACARTADARVFCWGDNSAGQLGSLATVNAGPDGGPPDYRDAADASIRSAAYGDDPCFLGGRCSPAAVQVAPGRSWFALAVGGNYGCALGDDGMIHCWGVNTPVLGTSPRTVTCENRSATWRDGPCQPFPAPVAGLPPLAAPPVPQTPPPGRRAAAGSPGIRATRVLASRRELRVLFPRDTARAWGWSELQDRDYRPSYYWGIGIEGMDGPRSLSLHVGRGYREGAHRFRSLEELVSERPPGLCVPGMFEDCSPEHVTAFVQDDAVVLTLRDSATVARLLALRPAWATVWHGRPELPPTVRIDSVRVEYVDPQVPFADSALRVEAAEARRRYEAGVNTISRYLSGPARSGNEAWMAVGDSATFRVEEMKCHSDVCGGVYEPLTASGWRVADTTVVRVRAVPDMGHARRGYGRSPAVSVIARRTGRTRVRVLGLTGPSDTLPSSRPVPRELEVAVVVTPPVARVELSPRVQTAEVGQQVELRVRALDARGRVMRGAPVEVRVEGGRYTRVMQSPHLYPIEFDAPGRHTITASFGGRTDTLLVDVAPAQSEPPSP